MNASSPFATPSLSPFVVALGMPFIAHNERLSAVQTLGLVLAFTALEGALAYGAMAFVPSRLVDAFGFSASQAGTTMLQPIESVMVTVHAPAHRPEACGVPCPSGGTGSHRYV